MRLFLAFALSAASLGGCASNSGPTDEARAPATAAEFGRDLAERECSRCHALGLAGESPRMDAPPFRDMRIRYNQLSFQRRMQEIAEGGHSAMPPLRIETSDARNVAAYIESLE